MAVAAGAIASVGVLALIAPFDNGAQGGSPAGLDGSHDAVVMERHEVSLPVVRAVLPKDVAQLDSWRRHQRLERLLLAGLSRRSNGLAVLPMVAGETAV